MKHGKASKTAELSAMIRTIATKNKYRKMVFNDPYSHLFIGRKTRFISIINQIHSLINPVFWSTGMNSVGYLLSLCRHRYIYDTLVSELKYPNTQVLIIGAGYDTSYLLLRDKFESNLFYELDFPATQQRKKNILENHFKDLRNLIFCEVDLKQKSINQALANSNFDRTKPAFIIIEGVLSYLTKVEIEGLLRELSVLCNQVKIIADYRKPGLDKQVNSTAKEWTRSFSKYHEKYVSFYTEDEMSDLLKKIKLNVLENTDLLDLWVTHNQLEPNKKLKGFGGLFIASNGK